MPESVADLRREGADQEVPEGILAEAAGRPGESLDWLGRFALFWFTSFDPFGLYLLQDHEW
jgi:hypothetical protein